MVQRTCVCYPVTRISSCLAFSDIQRNRDISNSRFVFPSWRIVSAYYAIYFFLRSVTVQKEPNVNIQRHNATINAVKHNVIPSLASNIWRFPFDIVWTPGVKVFKRETVVAQLPHLRYKYAQHPREPNRSPIESFEFIRGYFRRRSKAWNSPTTYNLIDLLRELRIWANYIDINNLINLWGPGYRAFLDQNLSTLLFFLGGVGELGFVAVRGEGEYLGQLQWFYDQFVCANPELENAFGRSPLFHRMRIYRELGLIHGEIKLRVATDINEISI